MSPAAVGPAVVVAVVFAGPFSALVLILRTILLAYQAAQVVALDQLGHLHWPT